MKKTLLALALLAPLAPGMAADLAQKVTTCETCHGPGGSKPIAPAYPVLAGQYANYLEHALKDYKAGNRKNAIMSGQAAALSDADIEGLALHFSQQQSPLYTPSLSQAAKP